jgi:hypothetical protein
MLHAYKNGRARDRVVLLQKGRLANRKLHAFFARETREICEKKKNRKKFSRPFRVFRGHIFLIRTYMAACAQTVEETR